MQLGSVLNKLITNNREMFIHFGVVTAISASPASLSIKVSGSTTAITGIRYLASYTPTVNDVVVCVLNERDLIVLGKLA